MADFTVYSDIDTLLQSTSNAAARSNLELGTAATTAAADYATAAQGLLADSSVQPLDDASTLGSDAATDGQLLTADGAGNALWETLVVPDAGLPAATAAETVLGTSSTVSLTPSTLFAAISKPFFYVDFQRVYEKGATANASVTAGLTEDLVVSSGAAANGGVRVIFANTDGAYLFGSDGIGFNRMNWERAGSMAFTFRLSAATTNGEIYVGLGDKGMSATDFGVWTNSNKVIGIRIANTTLYAMTGDGTTLNDSISTATTLTAGVGGGANAFNYECIISWDGAGNAEWFLDGVLIHTATTGIPSGISVKKHPQIEVLNNADAVNTSIGFGNIIIR